MSDAEFVAGLPRRMFIASNPRWISHQDDRVMKQAARLQRQGMVSVKPDITSKNAHGCCVDLALTQLGRTTFKVPA